MNMRTLLWYMTYCLIAHTSAYRGTIPFEHPEKATIPFVPPIYVSDKPKTYPKACPGNTPMTRDQWCEYSLWTDYTDTVPDTGVTREFWFDVHQATLAPDGRPRWALAINGSLPGPTVEANWGDTVVIHLRNSLADVKNGTSLHIHGLRQHFTNPMDGVVSVTQCPIAPGYTMTYRWRATQYGTTWYHSHIGLQTWEGVYGGVIIHGPASGNYDEDKGVVLLSDWDINTVDELWGEAETVGSPTLDTGLINGNNVFGDDDDSSQTGSRFSTSFVPGKSYRLRVTNVACDTQFKFSIDHHTLTVIAMDFVPIKPYKTTAINISIGKGAFTANTENVNLWKLNTGQRYDIIVLADQAKVASSFWLRATPQLACSFSNNADNIRGIIYYERSPGASKSSSLIPSTTGYTLTDSCDDEPASKLIPIVSKRLSLAAADFYYNENLPVTAAVNENNLLRWYINGTSMHVTWSQPTLLDFIQYSANPDNPTESTTRDRAVLSIPKADTWVLAIIETAMEAPHPIHLHGHDFLVVAQGNGSWSTTSRNLNLDYAAGALPKRDTALLPALGHLVLAFRTDNPGAWLMHCHIGWHLDQGFALQFVEREPEIRRMFEGGSGFGGWWGYGGMMRENCENWNWYNRGGQVVELGAGI
ncbi:unnamed protein product [Penicillium olsonii]|uniref:Uncharacterized protein n=1 Tax=Penicillium olsonii TaxID=99116 RepID=A0A9W4MNW9_PENOL|nr:unnamed protein product [Penicillium olsonii]CAG8038135.1 unnamed protein product [Penicillium olsonii]